MRTAQDIRGDEPVVPPRWGLRDCEGEITQSRIMDLGIDEGRVGSDIALDQVAAGRYDPCLLGTKGKPVHPGFWLATGKEQLTRLRLAAPEVVRTGRRQERFGARQGEAEPGIRRSHAGNDS